VRPSTRMVVVGEKNGGCGLAAPSTNGIPQNVGHVHSSAGLTFPCLSNEMWLSGQPLGRDLLRIIQPKITRNAHRQSYSWTQGGQISTKTALLSIRSTQTPSIALCSTSISTFVTPHRSLRSGRWFKNFFKAPRSASPISPRGKLPARAAR